MIVITLYCLNLNLLLNKWYVCIVKLLLLQWHQLMCWHYCSNGCLLLLHFLKWESGWREYYFWTVWKAFHVDVNSVAVMNCIPCWREKQLWLTNISTDMCFMHARKCFLQVKTATCRHETYFGGLRFSYSWKVPCFSCIRERINL